jgi:hypothetical protein
MDWEKVIWKVPVQRVDEVQTQGERRARQLQAHENPGAAQRQEAFLARLQLTPVPCPACKFPLNVLVAQATYAELYEQLPEVVRKDQHHACPRCGARVIYRVPLVGPAYAWELNLTDEQLAAILAVIGRKA